MRKVRSMSFVIALVLTTLMFSGYSGVNSASAESIASTASDYEEGTSDTDNIVNTTSAEKVLLVVSFGTSFNQSRNLTIGGIESALMEAYPDYQVRRAFTSQIIIDKLAERDNLIIDNVTDAMNRLVLDKVKEVVIQPTTVMNGFEYDDLIAEAMPFADKFESFKIGKHLLCDDIDYDEVAEAIVEQTVSFRAEGTAIVFMGHGTEHEANITYTKLQEVLWDKGYSDYLIGTVEAGPTIEDILVLLDEMNAENVVLRPLMIAAGDHANNDMAGDEEDSWKTILTDAGYKVETVIEGLGQINAIQEIFIRHTQEAIDTDSIDAEAPLLEMSGITADRIKNGTYYIEVDSSTSMFKIVDCQLTVEDNAMTAVITLSGQGFGKIYMGTGEQALKDTEDNFHAYTDDGERHSFTVPVSALDSGIDCAGLSIRKQEWYDHVVVFKSAGIPDDAFIPSEIDVELSGGTGRASIQSPATLIYRDGANYAQIVWSSSNYIYMLVDDLEYLPVNADGNSVFEIPIVFDSDMKVIACTTAMSEPKEIEYVLNFDSSSIK